MRNTLQTVATPTLVAGIAMLIARMQAQTDHPHLVRTVSSGIGSAECAARFRDGVWHDYILTHSFGNPRSHSTYDEPIWPSMDQERSLRKQTLTSPHPSSLPGHFEQASASSLAAKLATLYLYFARNPTSYPNPSHAFCIR